MTEAEYKFQWPPRVRMDHIRRLYESDALGLLDEALLDEVFIGMLTRCDAIHRVDEARSGRVTCPVCNAIFQRGEPMRGKQRHSTEPVICPSCNWHTTWGVFHRSFDGKQLTGGGAAPFVKEFRANAPSARTPQQKMLMIDRIIHQFHTWGEIPTRPCAVNVIAGKSHEVLQLLDSLAEGPTAMTEEAKEKRGKLWREREEKLREGL